MSTTDARNLVLMLSEDQGDPHAVHCDGLVRPMHFFSVILRPRGWVICEADFEIRQPYESHEYAVEVACSLALAHWRATGEPTVVRVSGTQGAGVWVEDARYGRGSSGT